MKKILKLLLTLLFIPTLASCSFFNKTEEENNKIVISNASFEYTYSTIKFDYVKDDNAIYYNAFFSGGSKSSTISRVEPSTFYELPKTLEENITYNVFLKAIANVNFQDSDLFFLGEMKLTKQKKGTENLSVSARITEEYAIEVSVENSQKNDYSPITAKIFKDGELFQTKNNIVGSKTFSTAKNLYAGQYTVSVSFDENDETLQSDELFFGQTLTIQKRELYFADFTAAYSRGTLDLSWSQDSVNVKKELTISFDGQEQTFIDSYKGKNIQSGMTLDANVFGSGEISFSLKLTPLEHTETFIAPPALTASTIISEYKLPKPDIEVFTDDRTGNFTIKNTNFIPGNYELSIHKIVPTQYGLLEDLTIESETVNNFPVVFEKAASSYNTGNYHISVKRLGSKSLELDSDAVEVTALLDYARYTPNVVASNIRLPDGGYKVKIACYNPWWINEPWANGSFNYQIDLIGCGDCIANFYGNQDGQEVIVDLPNTMMNGSYSIDVCNIVPDDAIIPQEFSYYSCVSAGKYELNNNTYTDVDNIFTDFTYRILSEADLEEIGYTKTNSHNYVYEFTLDKKYAYATIGLEVTLSTDSVSKKTTVTIDEGVVDTGIINAIVELDTPSTGYVRTHRYVAHAWLGDYYTEAEMVQHYKPPVS